MTDNEKIAKWAGWTGWTFVTASLEYEDEMWWEDRNGRFITPYNPTFTTDAEAMPLLDVLVEKGCSSVGLEYEQEKGWMCYCTFGDVVTGELIVSPYKPTRHEAIVAAVLMVIERGEEK